MTFQMYNAPLLSFLSPTFVKHSANKINIQPPLKFVECFFNMSHFSKGNKYINATTVCDRYYQ